MIEISRFQRPSPFVFPRESAVNSRIDGIPWNLGSVSNGIRLKWDQSQMGPQKGPRWLHNCIKSWLLADKWLQGRVQNRSLSHLHSWSPDSRIHGRFSGKNQREGPLKPRNFDHFEEGFFIENLEISEITDSRIHGFTDSRIHGFMESRIHGCVAHRSEGDEPGDG